MDGWMDGWMDAETGSVYIYTHANMQVLFYLARPERVLRQGATAAPAFEDVTSQPRWAVATWTTLEFRSDGNATADTI